MLHILVFFFLSSLVNSVLQYDNSDHVSDMNLLPLFLQIAQVGSSCQKMDLYHLWKQKLLVLEAVVVGDGHEKEVEEVR